MVSAADLPGASHLVLAPGVAHLDPQTAVFEAMLDGWARQQRTRFLQPGTIAGRVRKIRRMSEFTNDYPWSWDCADVEEFIDTRRHCGRRIAVSTARLYEHTLRTFLDFVTDPRYGWSAECMQRFDVAPSQLLHSGNTVVHVNEYEGNPHRRPLTYDEVQRLFDAADTRVDDIRTRHRKGALGALRDAALLKTIYAFGLRRREAWGWIWPTYATIRRSPRSDAAVPCSCDGVNPRAVDHPNAAPSSPCPRWTGSCRFYTSGSMRSALISVSERIRHCG